MDQTTRALETRISTWTHQGLWGAATWARWPDDVLAYLRSITRAASLVSSSETSPLFNRIRGFDLYV